MPPVSTATDFRLRFGAMVALLALLGAWAVHTAWPVVQQAEVAGSYQRRTPLVMPVGNSPERIVLHADGTLDLIGIPATGTVRQRWWWDPQERVVRTGDPVWDRRIRLRSTVLGTRLCMRICDVPLLQDQEERDEEVDLIRINPAAP